MTSASRCAIGVLIVLSIPLPALAAGPVTLGIKAGLAFANVSPREIADVAEFEPKLGPGGGGFATWELSDRFSLGGELLYVSKGLSFGKSEATDQNGTLLGTYETLGVIDYLEVPLLVRFGPHGGTMRPALILGPAFSFKLREREVQTGAVSESFGTDAFASTDVGLAMGGELRVRSGPGWSLIEVRYTYGLMNVAEEFFGRKAKNRALTVMAGYAF